MPSLQQLAQEAFEKARLFGGGFMGDVERQNREALPPEDLGQTVQQALQNASSLGRKAPDLEGAIATGLGAAGMQGGQDMGLFLKDTPLGDISFGPREALGLGVGMLVPGGPGGKAQKIASKASQNIEKSIASKAVPKIAQAAEEVIQPRLSRPGVTASAGMGRTEVNAANEAAEALRAGTAKQTRTVDGQTLEFTPPRQIRGRTAVSDGQTLEFPSPGPGDPLSGRDNPAIQPKLGRTTVDQPAAPKTKRELYLAEQERRRQVGIEQRRAAAPARPVARQAGPVDPGPDPAAGRSYSSLTKEETEEANQWARDKVAFDKAQRVERPVDDFDYEDLDLDDEQPLAPRRVGPSPEIRRQAEERLQNYPKTPDPDIADLEWMIDPNARQLPPGMGNAELLNPLPGERRLPGDRPLDGPRFLQDGEWVVPEGGYDPNQPVSTAPRSGAGRPGEDSDFPRTVDQVFGGGPPAQLGAPVPRTRATTRFAGSEVSPLTAPGPAEWEASRVGSNMPRRPRGDPRAQVPPATPSPTGEISAAKSNLRRQQYEAGYEPTDVTLDTQGNPIMPEGRQLADVEDIMNLDNPYLESTGDRRATQRTALTRLTDSQGRPVGPIGTSSGSLSGLTEQRDALGKPRSGGRHEATGMELDRYNRIRDERAVLFEREIMEAAGGDATKANAYRDRLNTIAYGTEGKRNAQGKTIWKRDEAGNLERNENGGKIPAEKIAPLWKRIDEVLRTNNGKYTPHQKVTLQDKGPDFTQANWQDLPGSREWLQREVLAILTGPRGQTALKNASPEQVADYFVKQQSKSMANAAHPDNPLSVSTKSHRQPSKFGTDTFTDEGASPVDASDLEHNVRGSSDTAHMSQADMDNLPVEYVDTSRDIGRQLDENSMPGEAERSSIQFRSDEEQAEYLEEALAIRQAETFMRNLANPKSRASRQYRNPEEREVAINQANARIEAARHRQAVIRGVSEEGPDAERMSMDQPEVSTGMTFHRPTDPRELADLFNRRPGTVLPEGVRGQVHYEKPPALNPLTGEQLRAGPRQTKEYTGEIPSMGMSPRSETNKRESDRAAFAQRPNTFKLRPEKPLALADDERAVSGQARPPGLTREKVRGQAGETVKESTKYFGDKMAEILDVIPRVGAGEFVDQNARKTWEDYMVGRLTRMLQGSK